MFHISAQAKYTHFQNSSNILSFKNTESGIISIYLASYSWYFAQIKIPLRIYTSGFRKHQANMAKNYVL